MPSAHTALVCALATAVAMMLGFNSVAFAIAAILAMVVMYDAAGVRQAVGRQSKILNRIVKELREKRPRDEVERDLGIHWTYAVSGYRRSCIRHSCRLGLAYPKCLIKLFRLWVCRLRLLQNAAYTHATATAYGY